MRAGLIFGVALMLLPAPGRPSAAPARTPPTCASEATPDRLRGLSPEGDLVLDSGRLARLAGIRLPDPSPLRDEALAWLRAKADRPVLVQGDATRDRWDRIAARIRTAEGPAALDLAHGLLEAGLAIVDPGLEDEFCHPEFLTLEDTARQRSLGVWADDRYNPIALDRTERLQERIGTFVLVEGRIRSVGQRPQRTYLNFGGHWADDFTIIIPLRTWKLMAGRGLGADALRGQRIRARGILQSWQGTALTIVIPDMIERLEGSTLPR